MKRRGKEKEREEWRLSANIQETIMCNESQVLSLNIVPCVIIASWLGFIRVEF